ncbi:hypothetical protein NN561_020015 [Cricetulus griseus]
MVTVCCVFTALYWNSTGACNICCLLCTVFSFNTIKLHSLSVSYTAKVLGLFFFMAVWCTNTSSLVSFLLMKPYPLLTLNHFTVPKTFVAMTSGGRRGCEAARADNTRTAAAGARLGAGLAAHGCSGGDWGRRRWLQLLPRCDVD